MSNSESTDNQKQAAMQNLSREKARQLLSAIGSRRAEEAANTEAQEYDWRQPHYFTPAQLREIEHFTKRVASSLDEKLTRLFQSKFTVGVALSSEHFASEILDQVLSAEKSDYYLAFGAVKGRPCGVVELPGQTATNWMKQLLGDSGSEQSDGKDLSPLEASLLADICTVTIETLSACGGIDDFQPAEAVTRDKLPLELTGCEELCRITFNIERAGEDKAESLGEFHVLVHSEQLGPAVGMGGRKSEDMSAADIRNAIVEHLHRIPVRVTAEFARTDLRLEELMTVQANDIILLDKRIDEPIELTVEGRPLFVGRCVKSEGNYGVLVAGLAEEGE